MLKPGHASLRNKHTAIQEKAITEIPITITYEDGIHRFSGLPELAVEFGIVEACRVGKSKGYRFKYQETPESEEEVYESLDKVTRLDSEFWETVLEKTDLADQIERKFATSVKKD